MKLDRLTHSPGMVADFYDEALTAIGALCERTWHDRLEVVAEGPSARLWNDNGVLHEVELCFPPPGDTAPRESAKDWSLRRVAVSLLDGAPDEALARDVSLAQLDAQPRSELPWPRPVPGHWREILREAFVQDLDADLAAISARQSQYLRRELERIDDYFENYEQELAARAARTGNENTKLKAAERLAAAQAEHERRRADQLARHEIRVLAHLEALLLVAEAAWRTRVNVELAHRPHALSARFVPRTRRWVLAAEPDDNP